MIILTREKDKDMFIKFSEEHNKYINSLAAAIPDALESGKYIKDLLSYCKIASVGNNKWDIFIKYKGDIE